jgi:hypothetical protein
VVLDVVIPRCAGCGDEGLQRFTVLRKIPGAGWSAGAVAGALQAFRREPIAMRPLGTRRGIVMVANGAEGNSAASQP